MAAITTYAFNSSIQRYHAPILINKQPPIRVRCVSCHQNKREGRRLVLIFLPWLSIPQHAIAGSIFDNYVKRKKLDPLEAYVPAVILTQLQIEDLGKTLEVDKPEYASCRSLLRSGPAASLRVNIRAVAQYASDSGNGKTAFQNVDQCLRALEELDSLLLHALRNDPAASVESMKAEIGIAVDALDRLLGTVPSDLLDKGKAIADAYRAPEEDITPENLDPEMKQLESLL
ncbi:uncharacterized protein LOC130787808 [Actinidia eriantha]|uniref:uncharacterized protein LOC130787808 n=1 Tax=Actinidia eriantha TaxID=165200 RepID=UPI00258DDAEE|nr:uncharacterized protein LOC130787808 [Actinidia eriantha]